MLQPLEPREVPAVNFWIGTSDDFDNPAYWTDGVPTPDDIITFNGPAGPISTTIDGDGSPTSPPPSGPQPYSLSNLTFPEVGDENYEPAYAGIRIINGYAGVVTFPANVDFGEYKQTTGSTAQETGTALTVTSSLLWTGGAVNATSNVATYNIIGATGQIGEDTTNLSSGSKFVVSGGANVIQTGVLTLLNGAGIDVLEDSLLDQRRINQVPPPGQGLEIKGPIFVKGKIYSSGGTVQSVRIESIGGLEVKEGGISVTGQTPGGIWGVKMIDGSIFLKNGETLAATHGVYMGGGVFVTESAKGPTPQIATIDGQFRIESGSIQLGYGELPESKSYSTLKITKNAVLWGGFFSAKVDPADNTNRDAIETDASLNCDPEFIIDPLRWSWNNDPMAVPATTVYKILVSATGFTDSANPTNNNTNAYTMARSPNGKELEFTKN